MRPGTISMLVAETASLDFTYTFENVETSLSLFGSNIENATELEAFSANDNDIFDKVRLINAEAEHQIRGSELSLRYYGKDIKLTAS